MAGMAVCQLGSLHTCPMMNGPIPHVGGPLVTPMAPTVLVGGVPIGTVGAMCVCVGPPDSVVAGSTFVFAGGGFPVVRMGDSTAHGGAMVLGLMTVLVG